jgi:hypothetical protein
MKRSSLVTVPVVALIVLLVVVGCSPTLLTTAPLTSLIPGRENQAAFFSRNASPVTSSEQSIDQATSGLEETAEAIENSENAPADAAAASSGVQEPNSLQPPVVGQGVPVFQAQSLTFITSYMVRVIGRYSLRR